MEKKKDENNFSKKQSSILIAVIVLFAFLITTGIFLSNNVKDTYSASGTVTFKGANGQTLTGMPNNGVCEVDEHGYVDPECVYALANICREISKGESANGGNTNCSNYTADQVLYKSTVDLFTQPIDLNPPRGAYYCRSCTSCTNGCGVTKPENKCYVCTKDVNVQGGGFRDVYTKAINPTRAAAEIGTTADRCSVAQDQMMCDTKCYACKIGAGYEYVTAIGDPVSTIPNATSCTEEPTKNKCTNREPNCYECRDDDGTTRYVYDTDHCAACGEDSTNYTIVEDSKCSVSCYRCNANANIMKWSNDGTGDTNCPGGYSPTTTPESSCKSSSCYVCKSNSSIMKWSTNTPSDPDCPEGFNKTNTPQSSCVTTNACYKCKTDGSIMKWDDDGNGDTNCPSGYDKVDNPESECPPQVHENPKTGTVAIIFAWIIGVIALLYSCFYVVKLNKIK